MTLEEPQQGWQWKQKPVRTYIQCVQEKPIPSAVLRVLKNILEESGWVTGGFRATFPGDENVKKLTAVIAACLFEYTKKNTKIQQQNTPHRIVHLKWVNWMACELYLNNT